VPDYLEYVLGNLNTSAYPLLFIGLLAAGEVVLIPALYLAVTDRLDLALVVGIAITATTLSDLAWYTIGRAFPAVALRRLSARRGGRLLPWLERTFNERGAQALFASKFVYGTRVMAQLLAGLHAMPLRLYLPVNTAAIVAINAVLAGIAVVIAR
jgi:membrane protein DedA with SNARE-associated domain